MSSPLVGDKPDKQSAGASHQVCSNAARIARDIASASLCEAVSG
jgi:hypothetical protein